MNQGIKTVLYPVKDIARAKSLFSQLLGVHPHTDHPYYVGFRVGDQEIGLTPKGSDAGMTAFYHVDDIRKNLQLLREAGTQLLQDVKDVGGGKLIATVKDADGNIIGLIQTPAA
jgi:predicted enzyme related to lactoylglutathione lyase